MIDTVKKIFFEPRMAFSIFVIFIVIYLVVLDKEGAFTKKFLQFGPSDAEFLTMKIDTWHKVITLYIIGFFSSLLTTYYSTVARDFIHMYIWNPAYTKTIEVSKTWTTTIVTVEPFLYWILMTLGFFIDLTLQLQFIIPEFIGSIIITIPYNIYKVNQKKYKK